MGNRKISEPIGWLLFLNLVNNYKIAKEKLPKGNLKGIEGHIPDTLSSFPMVMIIWESFLYENLLTDLSYLNVRNHIAWELKDKIEMWDIEYKSYFLPKLILGRTFDKSKHPFQDFKRLIQIRNSIVHFKWDKSPENAIKDLAQRKITLPKENAEFAWTLEISSINCYK